MRLDNFITEKFSLASRSKAANLIKKGAVFVNGKTVTKAGAEVTDADDVKITQASARISLKKPPRFSDFRLRIR